MILRAIASGSNGNCFLIHTDEVTVLFDAGISRRRIIKGMAEVGVSPKDLDYVFVTHAHSDHILGLAVLESYTNYKLVATEGTIDELCGLEKYDYRYRKVAEDAIKVHVGKKKRLKGITVTAFEAIHDIAGSVGYTINIRKLGINLSYTTDNAMIVPEFAESMKSSDFIIIESNHDVDMLAKSRRPIWLKNRIRKTHLSNKNMISILNEVISERTKVIFLAHLSGECNRPELVGEWMNKFKKYYDNQTSRDNRWEWVICPRHESSTLVTLSEECEFKGGISSKTYSPIEIKKGGISIIEYFESKGMAYYTVNDDTSRIIRKKIVSRKIPKATTDLDEFF